MNELNTKLSLDIKDAIDALDKVEKDLKATGKEGERTAKKVESIGDALRDGVGRQGVNHVRTLKNWFDKTAIAVAAVTAATMGTLAAMKAVGEAVNVQQSMSPLDLKAIEAANRALGGTIDQLTLMRTYQQTNLGRELFGDAAKAAAYMAKQFGFSKQHMLDAIHNGTLMETQLQALGISSKHLDNEVAKVAQSMGGVGGEVDEVTKSNIKARVTIDAIRRASKGWSKDTRQAGDAASKALAELKNTSIELGKSVLPMMSSAVTAASKLAKWLGRGYDAIAKFANVEFSPVMQQIFGGSAKGKGLVGKTFDAMGTGLKKVNDFGTLVGDTFADMWLTLKGVSDQNIKAISKGSQGLSMLNGGVEKLLGLSKELKKELPKAILPDIAKGIKDSIAGLDQVIADANAKAANARKRAREERKRQWLEERRQLQEQAKDLVRNINEKIAQVVADQGGSFGELASGLTDVLEKGRMFATTAFGRKGIAAAAKVAAQFQGKKNVDLMRQIELQKTDLGLRGKSLHAAKLMAGWMQGGAKDTREYLDNERTANAELRQGLQILQSQAKVAQIRKEQNNALKDITQFRTSAETVLEGLQARRLEIQRKGNSDDKAQIPVLDTMIMRLQRTVGQYRQVGAERQKILQFAAAHAQIEVQLEKTLKRQERATALRAAGQGVTAAGAALRAAQGKSDPIRDIQAQGFQKAQDLKDQIAKLTAESNAAIQKLVAGGLNGDSQQQLLEQIQNQERIVALKQRELVLVEKTTQAQIQGLTLAGQMQRQFAVTGIQMAAATAQQMKSSFDSVVGGFGDAMANVIASAMQADQDVGAAFGKATLEALGNLAMQWGAFFAIQGAGMLAGLNPLGAAVIAAGVGLTALGGVLKGAGGLVGPQPKASSTGGGSGPSGFRDRLPGAQPGREQPKTETVIIVTDQLVGSEEDRARRLADLVRRNRRAIGGRGL